jgi:hypothetical protein
MKFLVDAMLGKLAKWLRILGYDTIYVKSADDTELIRRARLENRILLTRDKLLAKNWIVQTLFIKSEVVDEQLLQVIKRFRLKWDNSIFSRCPLCNTQLIEIDTPHEIKDKVPEFVFNTYSEFWKCVTCNKIYWSGTHWNNIKTKVAKLKAEEGS